MKKTIIVVALAMALMLALGATPAFAKYAGYSSSKQYVPWAEANSLASANADAAVQAEGPHKGYATTTIKCAVCHSVHRGGNKLLNEGAACAYCHTPAYYGGGAVAADLISWTTTANLGPHSSRCSNTDCHGGPHGVGASTYAGPAARLLTSAADAEMTKLVAANADVTVADMATWNAESRVIGTAGVCERDGCHNNSVFGVVTAGATETADVGGVKDVTAHRVIAAATTTWNANGTDFPSSKTNLTIAYAGVSYCNSCHDLTDDNNGGKAAFPHAINGVVNAAVGADGSWRPAVWLTAGAYAGGTRTAVGAYNDYTGSAATSSAAGSSILDGTCLKCHKGSATTGLGFGY